MNHTKATQLFLNLFHSEVAEPAISPEAPEKNLVTIPPPTALLRDCERECYDKCVAIATIEGSVSAFSLQRRLRIGFALAERMMQLMKSCGLIVASDHINHPYKLAK